MDNTYPPPTTNEEHYSMKVIGAGFGRTGTMSLKVALEELGYGPCYHMTEVFDNLEHLPLWEAAVRGEPVGWEKIFASYQAAVDWPAAAFYKELMKEYPEAKVLLSVRDPEKWYESTKHTIYTMADVPDPSPMLRMATKLVWEQTFSGNFENRQHAIEVFERHNEEVKKHVSSERLLVYEVKEGWKPLCEFLAVEIPKDKGFPHLNDTEAFRQMVQRSRDQRD
jgi:hypothetical protein